MRAVFITLFIFFSLGIGVSAEIRGSVGLEKTTVEVGETVQLNLSISGDVENVEAYIPPVEGLSISDFTGLTRNSSISIINGKRTVEASITKTASIVAIKQGTYKVGPIRIIVDGQEALSEVQVLNVRPSSISDDTFIVTINKAKSSVYVGEPIGIEINFMNAEAINGLNVQIPWYPEREGINVRSSIVDENKQGASLLVNKKHRVPFTEKMIGVGKKQYEVRSLPLIVDMLVPGTHVLEGPVGLYDMITRRGFLRTKTRSVIANAQEIKIKVLPLPETGRPKDFSGVVGTFTMEESHAKGDVRIRNAVSVKVGNPIVVKLKVHGIGNVSSVPLPVLENSKNIDVKLITTKTTVQVLEGVVQGDKIFEVSVYPLSSSVKEIGSFSFSTFDANLGVYRIVKTNPFSIKVVGNEVQDVQVAAFLPNDPRTTSERARVLNDIHRRWVSKVKTPLHKTNMFFFWLLAPVITWGALCFAITRYRNVSADYTAMRVKGAYKRAESILAETPLSADTAAKGISCYVADRLNLLEGEMTAIELAQWLEDCDVEVSVLHEAEAFMKDCEQARFGQGRVDVDVLRNRAILLLNTLAKIELVIHEEETVR